MSYPDLSTILEVYPECEYNCYGYAPSQRRRCRMRTRKDNRDRASYLLKEGTRFLQHGLPVDGLLIELAPLVLCTRFHQYQADDLVRDWRAKLRAFQQQTLLDDMLKSLQELVDSRARSLAAGSAGQRFSQRVLSTARLERSAAIVTEEEPAPIEGEEEEEERGDRADEPEPQPEPQPSPRRTSTEASSPAVPSDAREPTVPQSEPRRTTRKPIEGDCDICMCPLRGQGSDEDGEGSEDSDDDNDNDNDNDVSDTASDNEHDDNEEDNLDDLVYCKNQCGKNYHKACIDVWLATQRAFRTPRGDPVCPSCPNCRAVWSS
ncbi:hypothetical protein CNMCM8980_003514 [Aspergillus fumigatiaffinis]|uniref:RING-type domain-containing protein n=1 Tax=Aspergillus fumigatiaffinis TaxID=340414 RepID=A0A8H4MGY4_9EURO|nr:hypothetical protein CNMCM5878_006065 [Aspergillus fumigatiaffinis]KAF4239681.1 hypothetical protein CNMCM6457_008601 [Aspergillus fumigatiaffinis]KAF4245629.1 hypothetical protein CNMCM6805_003573 [Aspergillus fumigatiaffinis]KAF4251891.1 hypothetical protein CNMCM8980_003514 [Aspergillus fumigatiaffinis]